MNDLSELFTRNPLGHSDQDVDRIVAEFRKHYIQFELGIKPKAEPKPKSKKTNDVLKDLGLI